MTQRTKQLQKRYFEKDLPAPTKKPLPKKGPKAVLLLSTHAGADAKKKPGNEV
eukprot:IDg7523t1